MTSNKLTNKPITKLYPNNHLTYREALTVLCSVVKHAGSSQSTKEEQGETHDIVKCFSLLLECSSRFLSALQQNRAQSRLLNLSYNKESIKFTRNYFQFQNKSYFQSKQQYRQHALCSHKARYHKPIRIPVRMVQII